MQSKVTSSFAGGRQIISSYNVHVGNSERQKGKSAELHFSSVALYCNSRNKDLTIKFSDIIIEKAKSNVVSILEKGKSSIFFTFANERERNEFFDFCKIIGANMGDTHGFMKLDEAEVNKKLYVMRAQHTYENKIQCTVNDIIKLLKEPDFSYQALVYCNCSSINVHEQTEIKGIYTRNITYSYPMLQLTNVSMTQKLMKSGKTVAFEFNMSFERNSKMFLHVPIQFYFKEESSDVIFRCAYSLEWGNDTWDKEFVESAVRRSIKIFYNYAISKIKNKPFDESDYNGEWRHHQPYVLIILALLIAILCVQFSPVGYNWYNVLAGFIALMFLFFL